MKNLKQPLPIHVYCDTGVMYKDRPYVTRLGAAKDLKEVQKMINEDRIAMRNTFGGLIAAPGSKGRTYGAFRAEWTEIDVSKM